VSQAGTERELQGYVMSRLAELKERAEEESIGISATSERDLIRFTQDNKRLRRPYIFLVENGNLRTVWKNDRGEQVGIQFRGNDIGQFVIFAERKEPNLVARSLGRDCISNKNVIGAAGALDLVFEREDDFIIRDRAGSPAE
jgi:hypothetical protein